MEAIVWQSVPMAMYIYMYMDSHRVHSSYFYQLPVIIFHLKAIKWESDPSIQWNHCTMTCTLYPCTYCTYTFYKTIKFDKHCWYPYWSLLFTTQGPPTHTEKQAADSSGTCRSTYTCLLHCLYLPLHGSQAHTHTHTPHWGGEGICCSA